MHKLCVATFQIISYNLKIHIIAPLIFITLKLCYGAFLNPNFEPQILSNHTQISSKICQGATKSRILKCCLSQLQINWEKGIMGHFKGTNQGVYFWIFEL